MLCPPFFSNPFGFGILCKLSFICDGLALTLTPWFHSVVARGKPNQKKGNVCAQRLTCFLFLAESEGVCAMAAWPQQSYWAICGGFGVKKDKNFSNKRKQDF